MDKQQEKFENYLRQFEPRRPRRLPAVRNGAQIRHVAAAIAGIVLCAGALWLAVRRGATLVRDASVITDTTRSREVPVSARELTRLALEDPRGFEEALTAASQRILPRFESSDSTLRVLAKQ